MVPQIKSRRDIIRTALIGSGILSSSTLSSASSDPQTASQNGFQFDGNELEFNTPSCNTANGADQYCASQINDEYLNQMEQGAETLTALNSEGDVDLIEDNGTVIVSPNDSILNRFPEVDLKHRRPNPPGRDKPCGITDLTTSFEESFFSLEALSLNFWLNDNDTDTAVKMAGAGAATAVIGSAIISATGIGAVSAPVATAIGAVLTFYGGQMKITNEGCGIKIEEYIGPLVSAPFYDMVPQ